jgi:hypothetical protein
MLITLAAAVALLFGLLAGWIAVQRAARKVAAAHPECGPLRLVGGGCGGHGSGPSGCGACANEDCKTYP